MFSLLPEALRRCVHVIASLPFDQLNLGLPVPCLAQVLSIVTCFLHLVEWREQSLSLLVIFWIWFSVGAPYMPFSASHFSVCLSGNVFFNLSDGNQGDYLFSILTDDLFIIENPHLFDCFTSVSHCRDYFSRSLLDMKCIHLDMTLKITVWFETKKRIGVRKDTLCRFNKGSLFLPYVWVR